MIYIRRTDPISLVGVVVASAIASIVIHQETNDTYIYNWFTTIVCLTIFWGAIQRRLTCETEAELRYEASVRVGMGVLYSFIWGWMVLTFLPIATPLMMVTVTMITGAIVAGSVATQSPCMALCAGFITPILWLTSIGLFKRGDSIDMVLSAGALMYHLALVMCMMTIENTVRRSIVLHFENESLIHRLQKAMDETIEATNTKSRFLASASHDLRQPIQAMSLVSEALKPTDLSDYQQNLFAHLRAAIDSTRNLVDSLLDFSKVESGTIVPIPAPFSADGLLRRMQAELQPIADEKGIDLRRRSTSAVVNSDIQVVEMILRNLVANAIRYTDSGGVLIACRERSNNRLVFEVWDTGVGLENANKAEIFKEFRQVGERTKNQKQGVGLGLAISQGLARALGSEITVESRFGHGSVFRFEVPRSSAAIVDEDVVDDESITDAFAGKSIMVIDDSERIRVAMSVLLKSWGCRCTVSETIPQALSKLAYSQPDLLLVDYRLKDGATGTKAINNIRTFMGKDVPAVIITGDSASDRLSNIEGTQPAMMRKPVSAPELKMMISSILVAKEELNPDQIH